MFELTRRPTNSSLTRSFMSDFDKLFSDMLEPMNAASRQLAWPSINIYSHKNESELVIEMAASGFDREEIEISIDGNALEVRGQHNEREDKDDDKRTYMLRENTTSFYRRIGLPEGADIDHIAANLEQGVLTIAIPIERKQNKRIAINGGEKQGKLTAKGKTAA